MARKTTQKRDSEQGELFSRAERIVMAVGLVVIIAGFYALAQMPVYGTVTMYVAPILLVTGFLVLIPVGILMGGQKRNDFNTEDPKGD